MGKKIKAKSITICLAILIVLSGIGFVFTENVQGSAYSDNDGVSADQEVQYTRDYDFDLSFYSGSDDIDDGTTPPPGTTSLGTMSTTDDFYAEQVWKKNGVKVNCGGIKKINCFLNVDVNSYGSYQFELYPQGHANLLKIERTLDWYDGHKSITKTFNTDSIFVGNPYDFFFNENTWRMKVVSLDGDEESNHVKIKSAELIITTCSSPGMTDTDGDGYDDGEEINNYGSSPVNKDTDFDGMPDSYENDYSTLDPTIDDSNNDDDNDGLLNIWEYKMNQRHPGSDRNVLPFDLTFSLEWDATDNYINKVEDGVKGANLYLMTATDGYSYIENVDIYDDGENWWNCNVRVTNDNAETPSDSDWPYAYIGEKWDGEKNWYIDGEVLMPREFENHTPDEARWYTTLVHELGHYVFGFYDEYEIESGIIGSDYPSLGDNALMNNNEYYMSYNDQYNGDDPNTKQMDERGMSCWEWFVEEFNTDGNADQKINFQPEAEQDDYRPWASYNEENVPVKVNYDFSFDSHLNPGNDYSTLKQRNPITIDITQSMNIDIHNY